VVIAILGILFAVGMAKFRQNRINQIALRSAEMLAENLNLQSARADALNAHRNTGDPVGGGITAGVVFNSNQEFTLFEIDPFNTGSTIYKQQVNPGQQLGGGGYPVIFTLSPGSGHSSSRIYFYSDKTDSTSNWSGSITVNCQGSVKTVVVGASTPGKAEVQ